MQLSFLRWLFCRCLALATFVSVTDHCVFVWRFLSVWLQEVEGQCDRAAHRRPIRRHQRALLRSYHCEAPRRSFYPFELWLRESARIRRQIGHCWKAITCICDFSPPAGSVVTIGNIVYVVLFGWWISLIYFLICPVMFLTVCGVPYGVYPIKISTSHIIL